MRYQNESARALGLEMHERPRALADRALKPDRYPDRPLQNHETHALAKHAAAMGALAATATAAVASPLLYAANNKYAALRALPSGSKAAMVAVPALLSFALKSHLVVADATANPHAYMLAEGAVAGGGDARAALRRAPSAAAPREHLSSLQRAANAVFEHPFKTILSTASVCYAAIFYRESTHPSTAKMLLSHRLIHTRVYGQFIAVGTTIAVMGFGRSMEANGGAYRVSSPVTTAVTRGGDGGASTRGGGGGASAAAYTQPLSAADAAAAGRGISLELLAPMVYVPLISGLGYGLRGRLRPETLTRLVLGVVGGGLAHAGYVLFGDSTV